MQVCLSADENTTLKTLPEFAWGRTKWQLEIEVDSVVHCNWVHFIASRRACVDTSKFTRRNLTCRPCNPVYSALTTVLYAEQLFLLTRKSRLAFFCITLMWGWLFYHTDSHRYRLFCTRGGMRVFPKCKAWISAAHYYSSYLLSTPRSIYNCWNILRFLPWRSRFLKGMFR
jgi:hypothetical protein